MHFMLSGLGVDLAQPVESGVFGAFDDAVREAESLLERFPLCEAVEIFGGGAFVADVGRLLN
ncbi:MAG: hypothetical protein JF588_02070 [Caulobacterales bacterium]|nr:hypothetical protein [Caulobacterales bacterium]